MKRNFPVLVLAAVMVLFFACSVSTAVRELTLVNRTGVLYMSPTDNEDWEEDLLEGEIFKTTRKLSLSMKVLTICCGTF